MRAVAYVGPTSREGNARGPGTTGRRVGCTAGRRGLRAVRTTLGRRATLKHLPIAAVSAAISPLTGCSGTALAFNKFTVGRRGLSIDNSTSWRDAIFAAGDGIWELKAANDDTSDRAGHGVWSMSRTSVTAEERRRKELCVQLPRRRFRNSQRTGRKRHTRVTYLDSRDRRRQGGCKSIQVPYSI